ncbi:sulfate adenylyltransferase subunit CysD [Campylobacter canadensis]|uniref:Sulfate adenylyltransferase subunit 2 n=1 Tax=Campylobacter canadensis TaxID=449520 RepID=A0ABS7WTJ0_9BACT|nr:sulfate adenylyltransferase subunit CysD [Campylobacter canadensis]MBZ7988095.1 sulfate adenylyltransferase subunit CysD [Campylobacter canadensis]MBZ7995545.1 sulfate adenylyltransferase subunit CysD [Campylobacter canadensis]MBZ7997342.1 sulfate adenylyltransferase subunit CysD [Campylobacter canadensis]MBZ7999070.1 sulfate adenylyltransferase subunit CysD [Campylobacter canadensis]MBZ8000885.1 sulfate adenylyltransferase subunit CysD [Campylobacter canadensis]
MKEYLRYLENESIYIIRETIAAFKNPAMLYSIGKDSTVLLHLIKKAFYPNKIPISLVHVDTLWKFKQMYDFRDKVAKEHSMIIYHNQKGDEININPFIHGSKMHTDIMKTQALKQCLDLYKFDAVFGGARRDEEKSRAKERIFSFRNKEHAWDVKNQRPELWDVFNTRINENESMRVFPLSNWTELDIWEYILSENIQIVDLYFAKERLVSDYKGAMILVEDERTPKEIVKNAYKKKVRFRTLGCYPLTGAIESEASCVLDIINELKATKFSERQGRLIDSDANSSMEAKKMEGYF